MFTGGTIRALTHTHITGSEVFRGRPKVVGFSFNTTEKTGTGPQSKKDEFAHSQVLLT